jgi:hypothetical protein
MVPINPKGRTVDKENMLQPRFHESILAKTFGRTITKVWHMSSEDLTDGGVKMSV